MKRLKRNAGCRLSMAGFVNQISCLILIEKCCQLTVVRGDSDPLNCTYRTVVYCEMETFSNYVDQN